MTDETEKLKAQLEAVTRERDQWRVDSKLRADNSANEHSVLYAQIQRANERNAAAIAERDQALKQLAAAQEQNLAGIKLAYEIEGGNRWPVEWDEDTRIMPALKEFKNAARVAGFPLPEWERKGPGFKRASLATPEPTNATVSNTSVTNGTASEDHVRQ